MASVAPEAPAESLPGAPVTAGHPAVRRAPSFGAQSRYVAVRHLRGLLRQPAYLAISVVQAVIWLPLFGSLFRRIVDIPGFGGGSYIDFLVPGVVVMSALFSSGWAGMAFITDMDRGVMDRMLVSPIRRGALIAGALGYQAVVTAVQTLIILLLGWIVGAHYPGGPAGLAVVLVVVGLVSVTFAALSDALALLVRQEETLIAAVNFLVLPLTFLSTAMMRRDLMPGWIRAVARVNPVDWAVSAGRSALSSDADWAYVGARVGYLAALAVVAGWLATRAFRSYQRAQ